MVDKDFYIGDFEKSVRTVSEASSLADEVTCLLSEAGFRLTKWMSNSREVLSKIPDADRAKPTLDLDLENLPVCLLYTSPSPRDLSTSRMPSSA